MKFIRILAVIPFIGLLGAVPYVNRVHPYVLGMPFFLFWIVMWVMITSGIMTVIYKLDPKNREEDR